MRKIALQAASCIAITWWLLVMKDSDSFFSVYVLVGLLGLVSIIVNTRQSVCRVWQLDVLAAFFPFAIMLANYPLFSPLAQNLLRTSICFAVSYWIAWNILYLIRRMITSGFGVTKAERDGPRRVFLATFSALVLVYGMFLYSVAVPGILTSDSLSQVYQALNGITSNHHPFYHTLLIQIMIKIGMSLFGSIDASITLYSVMSLMCMAAVFAFVATTLYELRVGRTALIVAVIIFASIPYHIAYSVTMWKDVLFGGSVALFTTTLLRIYKDIGKKGCNHALLICASVPFALFRSNGWLALLITFLCILPMYKAKSFVVIMSVVLCATFVLKHPVLSILEVKQPDIVEFLSIPEQQIARVLVEDVPITDEERSLAGRVVDLEAIQEDYHPHISDPVKANIRKHGASYLDSHKIEFFEPSVVFVA